MVTAPIIDVKSMENVVEGLSNFTLEMVASGKWMHTANKRYAFYIKQTPLTSRGEIEVRVYPTTEPDRDCVDMSIGYLYLPGLRVWYAFYDSNDRGLYDTKLKTFYDV